MAKKIKPQKIIKRAQKQKKRREHEVQAGPHYETPKGEYYEGVGRRKVATARVRIYEQKKGQFVVNDQLAKDYFADIPYAVKIFNLPFSLTGTQDKFAVTVKVNGSGIRAQLEAIVHGSTRALVKFDPAYKPLLKEEGLLTRDDRMKETRKPGRGGKARAKRQSPKR